MIQATLSTKGQVTIPKSIRDRLKLVPGAKLSFEVVGSRIIISPPNLTPKDWCLLRGSFKDLLSLPSTAELRAEAKREEFEIEARKLAGI